MRSWGGKCRSLLDNSGTGEGAVEKHEVCVFLCFFLGGGGGWSKIKTTGSRQDARWRDEENKNSLRILVLK